MRALSRPCSMPGASRVANGRDRASSAQPGESRNDLGKAATDRWHRVIARAARRKCARGYSLQIGREAVPVVRQVIEIAGPGGGPTYDRYTAVLRREHAFSGGRGAPRGSNRARERTRTQTWNDRHHGASGVKIRNAARRRSSHFPFPEGSRSASGRAFGPEPERRLSGWWNGGAGSLRRAIWRRRRQWLRTDAERSAAGGEQTRGQRRRHR